jgi:hypothetical protein
LVHSEHAHLFRWILGVNLQKREQSNRVVSRLRDIVVVFQFPILCSIRLFSVFVLLLAKGLLLAILFGYLFNGILLVGQAIQPLYHTMSQFSLRAN